MKHIVMLSGGKDSTYMIHQMIENEMQIDDIINVDTTKEFPAMYQHLDRLEKNIGKPITRLSFDFDYWFYKHIKSKGKNKGKKGYGWPDSGTRWCTTLKNQTASRYIRETYPGEEIVEYHGIAYDEPERINKNKDGRNIRYPLYEMKITEQMALDGCRKLGYDWGGLYEKMFRVSCYLCPLQRINEIKVVHDEYPELWADMKRLDKKTKRKYRSDYSLTELERRFEVDALRMNLSDFIA